MQLPDYKQAIENHLKELLSLFAPYTASTSDPKYCPEVAQVLLKHEERIKELDICAKPRIMLYGIYNAGKSTLLNAIMGSEKAEVGDVPTTATTSLYQWNGYELLDTPGIGAPIEHEEVANNELDCCQVIVFVVSSAGSFEESKIYERIRYIVNKNKKLLVALNDKANLMQDDPMIKEDALFDIQDKILRNIGSITEINSMAQMCKVILVNGQDALEGRLNNEDVLVRASNIEALEAEILSEIRRVGGFAVFYDTLRNLRDDIGAAAEKLFESVSEDEKNALNEKIHQLNEDYWTFLQDEREKVKQQCVGLHKAMYAIFPSEPTEVDKESMEQKISAIQKAQQNKVFDAYRLDLEKMLNNFSSYLKETVEGVNFTLPYNMKTGVKLSVSNVAIEDEILMTTSIGADSKNSFAPESAAIGVHALLNVLTKIPLPIPIPAIPIPPLAVILAGITILKNVFGESEGEKENKRIEARIDARRELEEKRERARVQWRREISDYCETSAGQFVAVLQSELQKQTEQSLKPLLAEIKRIADAQQDDIRALYAAADEYWRIRVRIASTLESLRANS
jgi:GTPase SAR1 family protein